jgi:hypothetical protein
MFMPFGLCMNALTTFQRAMMEAFKEISLGTLCKYYFIVYGVTPTHLTLLEKYV